jgi:hypothetical protein
MAWIQQECKPLLNAHSGDMQAFPSEEEQGPGSFKLSSGHASKVVVHATLFKCLALLRDMQEHDQTAMLHAPENAAFSRIVRHAPALIQDMALTAVDLAAAAYLADVRNGDDLRARGTRSKDQGYGTDLVHHGLRKLWGQDQNDDWGPSSGPSHSQPNKSQPESNESHASQGADGAIGFTEVPVGQRNGFEDSNDMGNLLSAPAADFMQRGRMQHGDQGTSAANFADGMHLPWHVALLRRFSGKHTQVPRSASHRSQKVRTTPQQGRHEPAHAATFDQQLHAAFSNKTVHSPRSSSSGRPSSTRSQAPRRPPLEGAAEAAIPQFGSTQHSRRSSRSDLEATKLDTSTASYQALGATTDPLETAVAPLFLHARISSTRALERFRNHVGIVANVRQGFGEVLDMYEDRCGLELFILQ